VRRAAGVSGYAQADLLEACRAILADLQPAPLIRPEVAETVQHEHLTLRLLTAIEAALDYLTAFAGSHDPDIRIADAIIVLQTARDAARQQQP
jgi:hypothetical protein